MSARDELNKSLERIARLEELISEKEMEVLEHRADIEAEMSRVKVAKAIAEEDDANLDAMFCLLQSVMQSLSVNGGVETKLFESTLTEAKAITGRDIVLDRGDSDETESPPAPESPHVSVVSA